MKLTILGSSDWRADAPYGTAGYVVETQETLLKLDFGRSNITNMVQAGIAWQNIDATLLSHIHPDHINDLMQYIQMFLLSHDEGSVTKNMNLYGPEGFMEFFTQFRKSIIASWNIEPHVEECRDTTFVVRDCTIRTQVLRHMVPNVGYRIEADNRSLCYTGDTGLCENLFTLAHQTDVLLTECCADDGDESPFHMRPQDIVEVAIQAHVKKVIVTHCASHLDIRTRRHDAISQDFPGEVVMADDLMTFDIG